jgi:hypothetical protein
MDDFDPEMMREFQENLNSMNASMGPLSQALATLASQINAQASGIGKVKKDLDDLGNATRAGTKQTTKKQEYEDQALAMEKQQQAQFKAALGTSIKAIGEFSTALLSGAEGFDKYGAGVKSLGSAAKTAGAAFGPLGMAIGQVVNIAAELTAVMLKQTDAQNTFTKEMNLMGGIVGITSNDLTDLARDAGYAAQDLGKLSPIIKSASQSLATFGTGTSDGLTKMIGVFTLTDDLEKDMRRYGYTLEEANEQQASYLQLQRTAGINLQQRQLTEAQVRKESLKYAKTLVQLSELTGVRAEQLKQEQDIIASDIRNKIRNMRDQNDVAALSKQIDNETNAARKEELKAKRDDIQNQIKVRQDTAQDLAGLLDPKMAKDLMNVIGTGTFDEQTKYLSLMGVKAGELQERFEGLTAGSDEYKAAMGETVQGIGDAVKRNVDIYGESMEVAENAGEIGAITGITSESIDKALVTGAEGFAERYKNLPSQMDASTAKGADKQKDVAAGLQVFERNVRTGADEFLDSINPFNGALGLSTLGLGFFTAALAVSTVSLMGMSKGKGLLSKLLGKGAGRTRAPAGAVNAAGEKIGGQFAKAGAGNLAKNVVKGGGVLAAGAAAYAGYAEAEERTERAEMDYLEKSRGVTDEKKLQRLKDERDIEISNSRKEGGSKAVVGAGGAVGGMMLGAAIGTAILPGIGTAIGGLIGSGLGAWAGSELGGIIGESLSTAEMEAFQASDAEVALMTEEERNKYDELLIQGEKKMEQAREDAEKQLAATKQGIADAVSSGLYDKDWIGDSEVDYEVLAQMREEGTLTSAMLEGILADGDINAEAKGLVQKELDALLKLEGKTPEPAGEDKEKSFAEMTREELWAHFEEVGKVEQDVADKQAQTMLDASKVVEEMVGSGSATSPIDPETGIIEVAEAIEKAIPKEVSIPKEEVAVVKEEVAIPKEEVAVVKVEEQVAKATEALSKTVETSIVKQQKPMNDATKEWIAYADSEKGQTEMAEKKAERTAKMAEMQTSAEDQLLAKQGQYQEVVDTGQYKGKDASESVMGQAKQALRSIEETKTKRMAMAGVDSMNSINNPVVDIMPDVDEAIAEDAKANQLAQTNSVVAEMSEYEKQSLAMLEQQNMKLARMENYAAETADGTQEIAKYSNV